jgi:hypothetical protein
MSSLSAMLTYLPADNPVKFYELFSSPSCVIRDKPISFRLTQSRNKYIVDEEYKL